MRKLLLTFILGLLSYFPAFASSSAVACDVTSGGSMKVIGIKTTSTSATITWTEGRHNGTRMFMYGIGSYGTAHQVQSRAQNAKDEVVTGLTPASKYMFKFYGLWHGKEKSAVTGTFNTDGSSCGSVVYTLVEVSGIVLSSSQDSLENVVVTITRNLDGKIIDVDTTDPSGGYALAVDPGDYTVKWAYPPFISPAPYPVKVIAGQPRNIPNQILTGAFQLGGTVLESVNGAVIADAKVTITSKADAKITYTRVTDADGHFNVGVTAGDYWVNVIAADRTLPAPVGVMVTQSKEMPNLILSKLVGIRAHAKVGKYFSQPSAEYKANGARNIGKSVNPTRAFGKPK